MTTALTTDVQAALEVARQLARAGVPVFVARPNPAKPIGFDLPGGWEQTNPDPAAVDAWRPGMALCAVMGRGIDLVDLDPRNGGDLNTLDVPLPAHYAVAATPSGGAHLFVAPLGVGSRDKVAPGIDVKAGAPDGTGRGFAFLAPTVKPSKVDGELKPYQWVQAPDLERLREVWTRGDPSGEPLAALVRERRAATSGPKLLGGPEWWRNFLLNAEPQSSLAAQRAITAKLADVEGWTPQHLDNFRTVLMRAAVTLGGYVGGGWLDEDDARARLENATAAAWGTPDDDDRRWIDDGIRDGTTRPFYVYTPEDEARYGEAAQAAAAQGEAPPLAPGEVDMPAVTQAPWSIYSAIGAEAFDPAGDSSDQGLAEAVAYRMFPAVRYASDAGTWLLRGREVWEETAAKSEAVSDWIVSTLAKLMPPGQTPVPKDPSERTEAHWQAVRRRDFTSTAGMGRVGRKLRAVVQHDHPASVRLAELDSYEEVLWAGGVAWHLRQCRDVPTPAAWVDPNTPHLRTALCAPDPTVPTPRWDAFLKAVLPDDELRAWALRVLSIALTGYPDAALPVFYGRERSGKTSLVEMLVTLLGSYAHAANPKLLNGQDTSHDAMVYDLKGRRLSFIDEGPKRGHDSTERLKQLTGGGSLTASRKYGNPITFATTHTLVMTTNDAPHLTDPALRARIRLIPCDSAEDVVRPARTPLLGRGLHSEAPGILAALMRETAAYLADRDSAANAAAPAATRGLAEGMATEQNPVLEWLQECTVPCEKDQATKATKLHRAFADWHQSHPLYRRMAVPSTTMFGRTLADAGVPKNERSDGNYWQRTVITGPGGGPSGPITPTAFMTQPTPGAPVPPPPAPTGDVEGSWRDGGRSEGQPSTPQNAWSPPLFSSSMEGMEGYIEKKREEEDIRDGGEGERVPELSWGNPQPSTPPQRIGGLTSENEGRGESPQTPSGDPLRTDQSVTPAQVSVTPPPAPRKVSNQETAAKAHADKISKAEARKALAEEKRLAAVAEVGGEVHPLPAIVDRAGHVIPCALEQAATTAVYAMARTGELTVDVETSGYPVGHREFKLRSVQLGDATAAAVFDPRPESEGGHADAIRKLLAAAGRLRAHSATADLVPLAHAGLIDIEAAWDRMYDTVLPAKLADPASTGSDPGLKKLAGTVLGHHATAPGADEARAALFKAGKWLTNPKTDTPIERNGWAQVPTGCETMLRYAASDVLDTAALAQSFAPIEAAAPAVLARERHAQRMTARITDRGVRLDPDTIAALRERHTAEQAEAGALVRAFGVDNPGSDQQVGAKAAELGAELPRTATGRPSVRADVLEPLAKAEGPLGAFVTGVLDYRHHETVLGLFLAPYTELVERGDGRARPTVYTLGTDTGRMSATRPNIQQLPREGGVRACITADPGEVLISADFSGVELRVAAALSGDQGLRKIIDDEAAGQGDGLHWIIARQIWGPEATKAHRYIAKRIVFGRIYGGGLATLSAQVGVTQAVGQQVIDTLDGITPTLAAWSRSISDAVKRGQTTFQAYSGRVIHLPVDRPHAAPNYAIQGSARELLVDALIRWGDTEWATATLFPVHDELDIVVPAEDGERATRALVECMAGEVYGVPIVADPSAPSFAWADST